MNNCSFVGRLTADPELKKTPNDKSVCSFTLAVKRPRVKDVTDFINCVAWNQSAEYLTKYARKGNLVAVSGALTSRNYEDKQGNKRTAFEIVTDSLGLLESHSNTQSGQTTPPSANASQIENMGDFEVVEGYDEDLPF